MAGRVRGLLERLLNRRREEAHGVSDAELLHRFARERDEAAFELLVWRHGAMVLGLCRRAVRDEQLAEDAFQAVFLVLARKAAAVRGNFGGWLFKVARRVSLRALQRRPVTHVVADTPAAPQPDSVESEELSSLLDAEIARLPERLRKPVVLCYLGGQSTEDAARELGCPRGTILSRLATARKRLADRLTRRGCTLPAALTATALSGRLVSQATAAASAFRTGLFTASTATFLATGVLQTMTRTTLLTALGGMLLVTTLVGGVGWVAADPGPKSATANATPADAPPKATPEPPKPVQPDPTEERKRADERRKKLEQLAENVRAEIESMEKSIDSFSKASGAESDTRLALLMKRLAQAESDLAATKRELIKMEAETAVLKKRLEDKNPPAIDAAALEEVVSRDARVVKARAALEQAKETLENVLISGGAEHPRVKKEREQVRAEEKSLETERLRATAATIPALQAAETARLKQRLKLLQLELEVKKIESDQLKIERDALEKAVTSTAAAGVDVQRMKDAVKPQRELLARIQVEIAQLRLGVMLNEPGGADAKLDVILKELAALRKDVQELKDRKK